MIVINTQDEAGQRLGVLSFSDTVSEFARGIIRNLGLTVVDTVPVVTMPQLAVRMPRNGRRDQQAGQPAGPTDPARLLLFFARAALRTREAYLTEGTTGGPPVQGPDGAFYGWGLNAAGQPEHAGTWIGCVTSTPEGRRVYLHPERVLDVVQRIAVPLEVPFSYSRRDLEVALLEAGLLSTEEGGEGGWRPAVRRQLPGNDLPGDGRQRVWDLPADEVVGDLDAAGAGHGERRPAGSGGGLGGHRLRNAHRSH